MTTVLGLPATTAAVSTINAEGLLYQQLKPRWDKVSPEALTGHTDEMRAKREKYLPKEEVEKDAQYELRLKHSYLYGAYRDTIEKCVSKPFSREVVLNNPTSKINPLIKNADRRGRSLTEVLRKYFWDGVNYGVGHMLVDLPNMSKIVPEGEQATLADEDSKLVPYLTNISPRQLIWWDVEETEDGPVLNEIHIRDFVVKRQSGSYQQNKYERITVYTKETWEIWESKEGGSDFTKTDSGTHSFKKVPLFSWYPDECLDLLAATPPMMDLADLNIAHWQSSSQQRNYLRFIRVGLLFIRGFSEDDLKQQGGRITLGPTNTLVTDNENAGAEYLEHKGSAYDAGNDDLQRLEAQMTIMGLQPFIEKAGGDPTATGRSITEAKQQSRLQMWCKLCSLAATEALRAGSSAAGEEPSEEFSAQIYSDFAISIDNIQKVDKIFQAYRDGLLTAEATLRELQRYGIVNERIDPEEEIAAAQEEKDSKSMKSLGLDPNGDPLDPNADPNADPNDPFGQGTEIDGKPPPNTKNPAVPMKKGKKPQPFQSKKTAAQRKAEK